MRKVSKIALLIWDILLIPAIIAAASGLLDFTLPFLPALNSLTQIIMIWIDFYLYLAVPLIILSYFLAPQIITLALIVLNLVLPFRRREPRPTKQEIRQILVLSVIGIIGAACAFIALVMMTRGEMGVPLP